MKSRENWEIAMIKKILNLIKSTTSILLGVMLATWTVTEYGPSGEPFDNRWIFVIMVIYLLLLYLQSLISACLIKFIFKLHYKIVFKEFFANFLLALLFGLLSFGLVQSLPAFEDNFILFNIGIADLVFFFLLFIFSKLLNLWK